MKPALLLFALIAFAGCATPTRVIDLTNERSDPVEAPTRVSNIESGNTVNFTTER